jgi:dihydroorotate dehydrogenase (NAD+) catalytic subunit
LALLTQQVNLSVKIADLELDNPAMLAAGVLGRSVHVLKRAIDAGAGAAVCASLGLKEKEGHKSPIVLPLTGRFNGKAVPLGFINAVGFNNPGVDAFLMEFEQYRQDDMPIVISAYAFNNLENNAPHDFGELAKKIDKSPAKAVELNLSSPNTKDAGFEVGKDPTLVGEIVEAVRHSTNKPILVKLSPMLTDIVQVAQAAELHGASAITAGNTARGMLIDCESQRPILTNTIGGISGPALKPIALRCVFEISEKVKIPVIGCGGISTWEDAVEYLLAGASAVQIGSGVALRPPDRSFAIFNEITDGIRNYMIRKGVREVTQIVGRAHKN